MSHPSSAPQPSQLPPSGPQRRKSDLLFLALGTVLFAASFSVIARLIQLGEANLVDGRNPISYCNVLFAGNIVAGLTFCLLFYRDWAPAKLAAIKPQHWLLLTLIAFFEGGLAPTLIFIALEETTVTSVVLVQSLQIPLVLLAAWILFREPANRFSVIGAVVAVGGIGLMVYLKSRSGMDSNPAAGMAGMSEGKVALASVIFVVATQIRRKLASSAPIGVYTLVRT
ncbi:MAG: DMT family transporter, partial [Verrucomicrobiota bacterium]